MNGLSCWLEEAGLVMGCCEGGQRGLGGKGQGPLGYGGVCSVALEPLGPCTGVIAGQLG